MQIYTQYTWKKKAIESAILAFIQLYTQYVYSISKMTHLNGILKRYT